MIDVSNVRLLVADKIRTLRRDCGMRQGRLALLCGLSRTSIVNIESCRQRTTIENLFHIASALNVEAGELLPTMEEICLDPYVNVQAEGKTLRIRRTDLAAILSLSVKTVTEDETGEDE